MTLMHPPTPVFQRTGSGEHLSAIRQLLAEPEVAAWVGVMAFATINGLLLLESSDEGNLQSYLTRGGKRDWIVGVDAVTRAGVLEALRQYQEDLPEQVRVRAYRSDSGSLYHPKLFLFVRRSGEGTAIVGASNLTAGGLQRNVELSARLERDEAAVGAWRSIVQDVSRHGQIRELNDELIESVRSARKEDFQATRRGGARVLPTDGEPEPAPTGAAIVVRAVPQAGGRFAQLHWTRKIVEEYFGVQRGGQQEMRLQHLRHDGSHAPLERRPLVYSEVNRNPKVELAGCHGVAYPSDGWPIAVFERLAQEVYRYITVCPGDDGYEELVRLLTDRKLGGPGHPPAVVEVDELLELWPDYRR